MCTIRCKLVTREGQMTIKSTSHYDDDVRNVCVEKARLYLQLELLAAQSSCLSARICVAINHGTTVASPEQTRVFPAYYRITCVHTDVAK